MNRTRFVTLASSALAIATLAGCAQGATVAGRASVDAADTPQAVVADAAVTSLVAAELPQLGGVVTDGSGRTLYRFDKDTAKPPRSNCESDCAVAWPPVLAQSDDVQLQGIAQELVGTVERADGSRQVTLAGWPLYRYVKDTSPGEANGQGAGGNWFAATPQGKKATGGDSATAVALSVMTVGDLGSIVTDREGMTLYRFDRDSADPSKSTCADDCALAWPPVIAESDNVRAEGIDPALVGTVVRDDGRRQVTIAGWPVYRFAKDAVPCDTRGQGVGGVWFVIAPDGRKAGV